MFYFLALATALWQQTDALWNLNFAQSCTIGIDNDPHHFFSDLSETQFDLMALKKIEEGDTVWLQTSQLDRFEQEVLPNIQSHFKLVLTHGDDSFCPSDQLLENQWITKIFAQNVDCTHDKVIPIPIGIDFHTLAYKGNVSWGPEASPQEQELELQSIVNIAKPTNTRILGAFVDFQHSDTMRASFKRYKEFGEDRTEIFKQLLPTGLIQSGHPMKRAELWRLKSEYAFSISPPGNGLDCHRTWEDLTLGCIVIVKRTKMDALYEGLPVVIIDDWAEITKENLQKWLQQHGDTLSNPEYRRRLTTSYWLDKINQV